MRKNTVIDKKIVDELEKIENDIMNCEKGIEKHYQNRFVGLIECILSVSPRIIVCSTGGVKQDNIDYILRCNDKLVYKSLRSKEKHKKNWDYVILLSADNEYDYEELREIECIQNYGGRIFSFIVFPDKILLPQSEISFVNVIKESLERQTSFVSAITTSKNLSKNAPISIRIINNFVRCYNLQEQLGKINSEENEKIIKLVGLYYSDNLLDWEKINLAWYIESSIDFAKYNKAISNSLINAIARLKNLYVTFSSNCRNEIIEERFHVKNVSDFAADLLSRYGYIQEKIRDYLTILKKDSSLFDYLFLGKIEFCLREIERRPEIAFVGGFSSGKTSFINWVLDMEEGRELRTSGGHNTAILTYIKMAKEQERVETVYKHNPDCFKWKLFHVNEVKPVDYYSGPDNARVIDIDNNNGRIIFEYDGEHFSQVLNYSEYGIVVKIGQIVKNGDKLTRTTYADEKILYEKMNISFRSDDEYESIINAIGKKKLTNIELTLKYMPANSIFQKLEIKKITDYHVAIRLIKRIQSLHNKVCSDNIRLVDISQAFWNADYLPRLKFFVSVDIKADCIMDNVSENLNFYTWEKYTGNFKNGSVSYSETPEGYLYTDYMTYYLNKGFLEYVEIVDTPGLGSISDEHDAITERYIRGAVDTLLVMIKIDRQSVQEKRRKFIFSIAEIYEKNHRNKNNVFFVCNIWSSVFQSENEIKISEQYCDEYYNIIQIAGFRKENFYVIDMRKMQLGDKRETFCRYPSDIPFKREFLKNVSNLGVRNSLSNIYNEIQFVLKESQKVLNRRLIEMTMSAQKRGERIISIKNALNRIHSIEIKDFSAIFLRDAYDGLTGLAKEISCKTTYKDWKKHKEKVLEDIKELEQMASDELEENEDDDNNRRLDSIAVEYMRASSRLDGIIYDLNQQSDRHNVESFDCFGMIQFPFKALCQMIEDHYNNYESRIHFIKNGKHSEEGAEEISSFIFRELEKSYNDNLSNYSKLKQKFLEKKAAYEKELNIEINELTCFVDVSEQNSLSKRIQEISKYQKKWNDSIVPLYKGVELIAE